MKFNLNSNLKNRLNPTETIQKDFFQKKILLKNKNFFQSNFKNTTILKGSELENLHFVDSNFENSKIEESYIFNSVFYNCGKIEFKNTKTNLLSNLLFCNTNFINTYLPQSTLSKIIFRNCNFIECEFYQGSTLKNCFFYDCLFLGSTFKSMQMKNSLFEKTIIYRCIFHYAEIKDNSYKNSQIEMCHTKDSIIKTENQLDQVHLNALEDLEATLALNIRKQFPNYNFHEFDTIKENKNDKQTIKKQNLLKTKDKEFLDHLNYKNLNHIF